MLGQKVEVDGKEIHYEKVGSGPCVCLLLPGGIGTSRTDFTPLLEQMNPREFTLIAWDPPGYGFSRPPERVYNGSQTFQDDADLAAALMQKLGYSMYSLLGWSDGAKTALLLSIKHVARVEKMAIWGGSAFINPGDYGSLKATEDTTAWSDTMKAPYVAVYGAGTFQAMWSRHIDFYKDLGDICKDTVKTIRCPTLILHGNRDPLCTPAHLAYLEKTIPDTRVKRFPTGGHNIHIVFTKEFIREVEDFLLE
ncbi:Valacyclovir hydrolase [Halotydeus destructor]|nr:Valacyclovir hydrolase [Halotydeus destructor]